nr:rho GTPase-activating protein gacK-like [Ipomoea batatas]
MSRLAVVRVDRRRRAVAEDVADAEARSPQFAEKPRSPHFAVRREAEVSLPEFQFTLRRRLGLGRTSGSLQSSSGGDDEFDSRGGDSISALLAQPRHHVVVDCISHHPQPPHSAAMYNPLFSSKLFEPPLPPLPAEHNSTPPVVWPKTLRPEINPMLVSGGALAAQSAPVSFTGATAASGGACDQPHVVRNPKKRSRASRRAPTTVLTTDTSNFRAMVQEFTGIPSPPFTSSLPFSRTLASPSAMRSGGAAHFADNIRPSPPYLRRPFPQKIQPLHPAFPPPPSPSPLVDVLPSSTTNNLNNISSGSSITPSTLLGISSNTSQIKIGGFMDAFASSNTALPSLISPSDASMSRRSETTPASFDGGGFRPENSSTRQLQSSSNNNIFSFTSPAAIGKLTIPATSSNFHGYKSPENVVGASRGEGTVESWICSSE